MIGAEQLTVQLPRVGEVGEPGLELSKLTALDDTGAIAVHGVSLTVRGGEIVGIAGVSGNGQRQLVEVLAGQRDAESGKIHIRGDLDSASREEMRRHKMSLLPEEPLKNACVGGMSVADNIAFREFDRAPFASGGWWLNRSAFRKDAERKIGLYKIKTRIAGHSDFSAVGRQRAARGTGAGTRRRSRGAHRRQSLLRAGFRRGRSRSMPRSWPPATAAPPCC